MFILHPSDADMCLAAQDTVSASCSIRLLFVFVGTAPWPSWECDTERVAVGGIEPNCMLWLVQCLHFWPWGMFRGPAAAASWVRPAGSRAGWGLRGCGLGLLRVLFAVVVLVYILTRLLAAWL